MIHEPAIRLRIPHRENNDSPQKTSENLDSIYTPLNLEQNGYLRPFDVAGILWPTGYLLSLCLGDIVRCPIPELHTLVTEYQRSVSSQEASSIDGAYINHFPLAIELGTGIGAASIALAKSLERMGFPFSSSRHSKSQPWVVATDFAPHALALTMANAKNNHVKIGTALMDYFNQSSVRDAKDRKNIFFLPERKEKDLCLEKKNQNYGQQVGYPLVFGSSLQGLFQETDRVNSALWRTLDELIDLNNPHALAILVHNRADPLKIPNDANFSFRLVRRLSGSHDVFGNMKTRTAETAEFEIYVFKPEAARHGEEGSSSITAENLNIEL